MRSRVGVTVWHGTAPFFRSGLTIACFHSMGKCAVDSEVLTNFVMTGRTTSSESHTKVVGRGSSTHDFFSRFLNKIVDVLFTQIPEGMQYYIRVDHRFVRRYEIMTIRLTFLTKYLPISFASMVLSRCSANKGSSFMSSVRSPLLYRFIVVFSFNIDILIIFLV